MRVRVRVRPGARTDRVGDCWDGQGGRALLVSVRARAVDGAANAAVVRALAEAFGVSRNAVRLLAGGRGRDKVVMVDGDEGDLADRLVALLGASGPSAPPAHP